MQFALANLRQLQDYLGENSPSNIINAISEKDLRQSRSLRTSVCEYKEFYFYMSNKPPKSFEKQYESEE